MSYIDFNYEKNSVFICKGDTRNRERISISHSTNEYDVFEYENKFKGIEILDFLSPREQDGLKGEFKFKELLENNSIPYLYIGQGPLGIERSEVLIEKTKSKRADFLVNIQDMGTILVDVKCRGRLAFHESSDKFFSIFTQELDALNNLQHSVLMPVWLAFINRDKVNDHPNFHLVSVSSLMKFWSGLYNYYFDDFEDINVLRIPNELLTEIKDKVTFEVGHKEMDQKLLSDFAELNVKLNNFLKSKIKETIKNRSCFKTRMFEELQSIDINFCYQREIDFHMQKMIDLQIIEYTPKKPLRLFE